MVQTILSNTSYITYLVLRRDAVPPYYWQKEKPVCYTPCVQITIDDFYKLLYRYVKPCIEAANAGYRFDWGVLKRASVKFEDCLSRNVLKYVFAQFALALCDEYKNVCNVGVDLWLKYFMQSGLFWVDYPSRTPNRFIGYTNPVFERNTFSYIQSKYDSPVTSWFNDPLLRAFLTGDLFATKILVKYGLIFHLPEVTRDEYHFAKIILLNLGMFGKESYLFINRKKFSSVVDLHYPSEYEKRRMFLVVRGVYILSELAKQNERYLGLVDPLKLMFQTTPVPYITLDEIRKFLHAVTIKGSDRRVEFYCRRYAECFKESRRPFQPRSLKHLSRCRVRESLRSVCRLPLGVRYLNIPPYLQRYVLIQEDKCDNHLCFFDSAKVPEYPGDIWPNIAGHVPRGI